MQTVTFGTDGFRGVIAKEFTFRSVERITRAYAAFLQREGRDRTRKRVVVGYDRRFLSDMCAQRVSSVLSENGIDVFCAEQPVPTPAVSLYLKKQKLDGGVIITASHNPPYFNGYKIKNKFGASAFPEETNRIQALYKHAGKTRQGSRKKGFIKKIDLIRDYIAALKAYVDFSMIRRQRFSLLVDTMYGSGSGIYEQIFAMTQCRVRSLHAEHNPSFGGVSPEPIEANLGEFQRAIRTGKYDLGIALDGDADRIAAVCPNGEYISSHYAIALLLLHLVRNRVWTGKVVKSINTTMLVDKIAGHYHLPLIEVPVGFKHIASRMIEDDILLGGEESGGIGFRGYIPERDGILAGLLLMEMLAREKKPLRKIIKAMERQFGRYIYMRKDIRGRAGAAARAFHRIKEIRGEKIKEIKTYDGTKFILADESWLLIRPSGTESIVRVYAESRSRKKTEQLIHFGCNLYIRGQNPSTSSGHFAEGH